MEAREHMLARLAALVAVDAPAGSYLLNLGAAVDVGVTLEDVQGVLIAVAPVVGTPRIVSAAENVAEAFGIVVALAEAEAEAEETEAEVIAEAEAIVEAEDEEDGGKSEFSFQAKGARASRDCRPATGPSQRRGPPPPSASVMSPPRRARLRTVVATRAHA